MEFEDLMAAFGRELGIPELGQGRDGVCNIEVDGMSVSFMAMSRTGQLVTWADVCVAPPEGREQLYQMLMEAMFMGRATAGGSFSIDRETGNVYLHRFDTLQTLDLDSFKAMLEKFVNVLEEWRQRIADFRPDATVSTVLSDQPGGNMPGGFGLGGFLQV